MLDLGALVRPLVLGRMQPAGIPIDHEWDLGNVAIVDTKRLDPLPAGPLCEMLEPLGEPAAEVAELIGGRARARSAGGESRSIRGAVGARTVRVFSLLPRRQTLEILVPILACGGNACALAHLLPAFDRCGSGGGAIFDLDLEHPAGDRAVHERDAVRRPQPEMARSGRVGREDRRPPAAAPLHEPVAESTEERARPRQREPLSVGWVRDHESRRTLRPHLLEVPLRDHDALGHARRLGTRPRGLHRLWVEVARPKRSPRLTDTRFEIRDDFVRERLVAVTEPEEAMRLPPGPPQPGRHPRRDRGRLDHERPRAAQRIDHGLTARCDGFTGPPPAGDSENPRREHLRKWRLHLPHPPAALVERPAGRIAEDRGHVAHQMQREPERRPAQLHARPFPARRPQLVHDRVLDDLCRIERVRGERVVDRRIDTERVGGLQLLGPVDVAECAIERLGRLDPKPTERLEHADRRP